MNGINKTKLVLILIFLSAAAVITALLPARFFYSEEGFWTCENGQWIKKGVPSVPRPKTGCEEILTNSLPNQSGKTANRQFNFIKTGNLVGGNQEWNLIYEEPGAPALKAKLNFTKESACGTDDEEPSDCAGIKLSNGDRIRIWGDKNGETITVSRLLRVISIVPE